MAQALTAIMSLERSLRSASVLLGESSADNAHELVAMRDLALRAKKLLRAAQRPQALGFFGPSQAGKSFLVGALLSHEVGTLDVLSRGKTLDFLKEINPAKGVESTGVVTRFTTSTITLEKGDFYCRLLSLETLLESLATGFLVECTSPGVDPERVERVLRTARLATGPKASPLYREAWETVWHNLQKKYQDRHPYLNELRQRPELQTGAWKSDIESRAGWLHVFSLLWGGQGYAPPIDRLAGLLVDGLELLSHSEGIEAHAADVQASSQGASLIDAGCLNALGTEKRRVRVHPCAEPMSGAAAKTKSEIEIDPGVLAALIAEVVLPLRPAPGSLLDKSDMLDFPGGRALKGINGFGPEELRDGNLENAIEVMKRGKLTFLFEQFAIDREITALCLCSPGPTKPEAIQLQTQVESWLRIRYGAATPKSPDEVERPSLFVALTKFDMSLGALRSDNAMARWESRVQEACIDFWARSPASWVQNWGRPHRPFANLFWIRNPYADQMRALGPDDKDYAVIKEGYFGARAVERHIERPDEKWAAVEGEENGLPRSGVPLLAGRLREKMREGTKEKELAAELAAIRAEAVALLRALTPSQDENDMRERAKERARLLLDGVAKEMEARASGAVFGELIELLSADMPALEAEVSRTLGVVLPMSVKTADKVKRVIVQTVKWWRDHTLERLTRSSQKLPLTAVDGFVREVSTSKKLLVALAQAIYPLMSRTTVDPSLLATVIRLKVVDMMVWLDLDRSHPVAQLPVRLSSSPDENPDVAASAIDWSDVDFDSDDPLKAQKSEVVFAGNRYLQRWSEHLERFYLENAGQAPDKSPTDARVLELTRVLSEVEAVDAPR